MVVEEGEGAVELLEEHGAGEFVGEGQGGEREAGLGGGAGSGREAIGAADGEGQFAAVLGEGAVEIGGEPRGVEAAAGGIEQNEAGAMEGDAAEQLGFGGVDAAAGGDFLGGDLGETGDALEVLGGPERNGGVLGFANPENAETHREMGMRLSAGAAQASPIPCYLAGGTGDEGRAGAAEVRE